MQNVLNLFGVVGLSILCALGICAVVLVSTVVYQAVMDVVDDIKKRKEKRHGKS